MIINIDNLEVGKVYKSYRQLCQVLGVKIKSGDSKVAQIKEFERHFSFSRDGNKITVNEIYSEPLDKIDLRYLNNYADYTVIIEKLILDLLVSQGKEGKLFLSSNRLLEKVKMINENYIYCKFKTSRLSQYMNISKEEIEDFYSSSSRTLKRNLENALNNLVSQSLIHYKNVVTVCEANSDIELNENNKVKATRNYHVDEFGDVSYSYDSINIDTIAVHREATDEELRHIQKAQRSVLKVLDCHDIADVYKKRKNDIFFDAVREILFNSINIDYYYNSYEIIFLEENVKERWDELELLKLDDVVRKDNQTELNDKVVNRINDNAIRRNEKALFLLDSKGKTIKRHRLNDNYIKNSEKLSETLIHKDAEKIEYKKY